MRLASFGYWPHVGAVRNVDLGASHDPREPGAGKSAGVGRGGFVSSNACGAIGCVVAGLIADRVGAQL